MSLTRAMAIHTLSVTLTPTLTQANAEWFMTNNMTHAHVRWIVQARGRVRVGLCRLGVELGLGLGLGLGVGLDLGLGVGEGGVGSGLGLRLGLGSKIRIGLRLGVGEG